MRSRWIAPLLTGTIASSMACSSPPEVKASRLTETRVIAVVSTPAEARGGQTVEMQAIVASPRGFINKAQIEWAMCTRPRSPADPITVSPSCFRVAVEPPKKALKPGELGPPVIEIAKNGGLETKVKIPSDACAKIGPQVQGMDEAGNQQRPPDADITGGYQLPVRLALDNEIGMDVSFARQRVRCNLANAPAAAARDYDKRYKPNENPVIAAVDVEGKPLAAIDGSASLAVHRGAALELDVRWAKGVAEPYVLFDPKTRDIEDRVENLEIAWYTDGGELDHDRTTPEGNGDHSSNVLFLDGERAGKVHVWITVRDDRGGVGVATFVLEPR